MQFVKDGPNIPDELLQAHEDGNVVFFCGAGISYPADLPGFKGLVDKIYLEIGETKNEIESNVYDREQFDSTLDLLERRVVGERQTVRKALLKSLKPNFRKKHALRTHEPLLKLSCDNEGMTRLVTTNFDRIFEKVIKQRKLDINSFVTPLLPIPKKSRWDGLVYLHGLIPDKENYSDLNRLVFTSGDFGLAYLTERWASRFVSELFRSYVICFVGYSINDPVLRYMMDALAADRMLGEDLPDAYAFADFKAGNEDVAANEWKAKNVIPILYEDHSKLHDTLDSWAQTYSEGSLGKESIVAKYAMFPPIASTQNDDFTGRVIWALSEPNGLPAKRFAELNPCPHIDWLEAISERRYSKKDLPRIGISTLTEGNSGLSFSLVERPSLPSESIYDSIRSLSYGNGNWDRVMSQICNWLLRHLNDPKLVYWLIQYKGELTSSFKRRLEWKLSEFSKLNDSEKLMLQEGAPNAFPDDEMMRLWKMLLAGRVHTALNDTRLYNWIDRVKQHGFNTLLKLELRELLAPKISIKKPYSLSTRRYDWELKLTSDNLKHYLNEIISLLGPESLAELFDDFQVLLVDALDLAQEMSGGDNLIDNSHWDLPSISHHMQNRGYHDWIILIELLRDSWLQILSKDILLAREKAVLWFKKPYPVFKRLALFAASQDQAIAPKLWCDWLCLDDAWWLWDTQTQRETMRLLVLQGENLDQHSLSHLEVAILSGLPRRMFREDLEVSQFQEMNEHAIWLHLAKLDSGGANLSDNAETYFKELSSNNPKWVLDNKYQKDEFSHWMSGSGDPDYEEKRTYELAPTNTLDLMEWLKESKPNYSFEHGDNWRDVCVEDMSLAFNSLYCLFVDKHFPENRWNTALSAWSSDKTIIESWKLAAPIIVTFSDKQFVACIHYISRWLQAVSKSVTLYSVKFILLVERVFTLYPGSENIEKVATISSAINHPIGISTEALFNYWFTTGLQDNTRIAEDFSKIFHRICVDNTNAFDQGKVIVASRAMALYRVDPIWTRDNLVPLFDWVKSERVANTVWNGFLWGARIYLPLMEELKEPFIDTAMRLSFLEGDERRYIEFLIHISLEQNSILSNSEIRLVFNKLPLNSLENAVNILNQILSASERKEELWKSRILPLWKNVWPKSKDKLTPKIADSLIRFCLDSGDEFPNAFLVLKDYIGKVKQPDYVVSLMAKSKTSEKFPIETLELLDLIVDQNSNRAPYALTEALGILGKSNKVSNKSQFKNLLEFNRRFGS